MKHVIITIVVIAALIGGYKWVSTQRVSIGVLEGEKAKAFRGDLEMPITANGYIEPVSVTKIKSEASGEVVKTPFDVGMMITKGDLLVRLDPSDEQRSRDRAEAEHAVAQATWEQADTTLRQRTGVGVALANAKLKQTQAQLLRALSDYKHITSIYNRGGRAASSKEVEAVTANKLDAESANEAALAEQEQARLLIETATHDKAIAEENRKAAKKALEDAEERLQETQVFSPIDGMVLSRAVQVGEMVQSGKTSLTGGTVLMELADVGDIYAVVNVDEADIGLVRELAPPEARPGTTATQPATLPDDTIDMSQLVEVKVESFRDKTFKGVIERIAPQSEISQAIATFKVRIRIAGDKKDKEDLMGVLNSRAEAHFTAKSVTNAILVPYDAFHKSPDGEGFGVYVPVIKPGEKRESSEFRPCTFGADNGTEIEVIEGLAEGEEVWVKLPQKTRKEKEAEQEKEEDEEN